uniref:Type I-C CRISPR-associated protein Cas8c/Csd1 n=1 Tax=mine drainage metagenome TaxID=410659 RepID=E6QQE7_9ZZZZ
MSWIQKLYETYEQRATSEISGIEPWPVAHMIKKAHVEVVIDGNSNFLSCRARKLEWNESPTLIPATESSAGRSGAKIAPHPLCEEIGYCASDFPAGDSKKYAAYEKQLEQWCASGNAHPKALAILTYLKKHTLWSDLNNEHIFPVTITNSKGQKTKQKNEKVFIRWRVESVDMPLSGTWEDSELINAWSSFDRFNNSQRGFCMVTGGNVRLAQNHSRFIRYPGDGAKLISSNDTSGFTFRGRFIDADQACGVSFDVTQKAHNALRWLIARQAYRNGDQAVVAWAVSGKRIPDLLANSFDLFGVETEQAGTQRVDQGNAGQAFGVRLKKLLAGYHAELGSTNEVVVMGLDSATPGRLAMTYYRELDHAEFIDRIEAWHRDHAWYQNYGKAANFIGAPAPKDIAEAAFGSRANEKLLNATVERLLPCILDGQLIPRDLVESTVRRASNRVGLEHWEWEKYLGIACALFSGYHKERGYQMVLELDRTTRDYLYGRLLAIAENIEDRALYVGGEKRDTSAAKLMQRFSDHPYSAWRTIELSLSPYKTRLRAKRPAFLAAMEAHLDKVVCEFQGKDFTDDRKLSGEFLLGYHCQRQTLRIKPETEQDETAEATTTETN